MCDICRHTPCHPRCPNADEPKSVCKCDICGCNIYEDETMYIVKDDYICESCIDECKTYAEAQVHDD